MSGELLKQLALPVALFAVLFGMGLSLVPADFRRVVLQPKAKIIGLTCQLLLLPSVAFALALLFRLPGELAVGLMVLAACPGGATSNVITHLSRGDTALSVSLTAVSSVVCVFTIPWIVRWSMDWFLGAGAEVALPFWKTLGQLTLVTILPILCGMTVRRLRPTMADRLERPAAVFSLVFLALIIAAAVAREKDLAHQFVVAGPAAISLNIVMMLFGFVAGWLFGLPRDQRITLAIETGIQNGTLALGITLGLLESARIAMPSVVYCLFMFLSGAFMIARFGRRPVNASSW
ncbi:MAG: bile acid:sodium symporter family protein [Chthoniobacterales bacterium]|jgi:BASS family bile acid:Na+ symporter